MSLSYRSIIAACLLMASSAHAFDVFVDVLYLRATETADWAYNNALNSTNNVLDYQTAHFHYDVGYRVGLASHCTWDNAFYFTKYHTTTTGSVSGNLVSGFLGGKFEQGTNFFKTGQLNFKIDFNMFDWDLGKTFYPSKALALRPIIGMRGGWINQYIDTAFQGTAVSVVENVKNNFSGVGIKGGIETEWILRARNCYNFNLFTDFIGSYMWGYWKLRDVVTNQNDLSIHTNAGNHQFGQVTLQAIAGLGMNYKKFALKVGYEISDWLDMYQVLDDGTGAHDNDLILQGLTVLIAYRF